jgi:dTDP-4-amino-4,6-dideoxygalactose transaminase
MRPFRHQLAAYSPITMRSIARALLAGGGNTSRIRLADQLRKDFQCDAVHLVDSGTHALQLAIESALSIGAGKRVVALPAFGCFDLATAIIPTGAKVVFYDLDPSNLSPDDSSLRRALEQGAGAAVITPLYGMPVNWSNVESIARPFGIPLIEDAAQGHGASWNGRPLGSLGDCSVLSFSRGKGWTGGYGGALLTRGVSLPTHLRLHAAPGAAGTVARLGAQWALGRPALYGLPRAIPGLALGETVFHSPTSVRLLGEAAARALLDLEAAASREAETRRRMGAGYMKELAPSSRLIHPDAGADPGYLRFPYRVSGGMSALSAEAEGAGLAASYPQLLQDLPVLQGALSGRSRFPGADELVRDLITLPTHSLLTKSDRLRIARIVA